MPAMRFWLLSDPASQARFRENVPVALEPAPTNAAWAAELARAQSVSIMIEAVNSYENGPYLLDTTARAIGFLDAIGADDVALQYDVDRMQRMEGNLSETISRLLPRIDHVQIADLPSRSEPGTGEINYRSVLGLLERGGYEGWVGLEYYPSTATTEASPGWMRAFGFAWCRSAGRRHRFGDHGSPHGVQLLRAGCPRVVHNRTREKEKEIVAEGAEPAGSPREAAPHCEVVITMLPDSPDVEPVYLGDDGVIAGVPR
jgi:hypothetical protein